MGKLVNFCPWHGDSIRDQTLSLFSLGRSRHESLDFAFEWKGHVKSPGPKKVTIAELPGTVFTLPKTNIAPKNDGFQ